MALGGGSSASMLLGMPPSWLGSNVIVPTYALSFFLVQYTVLYDILNNMVPPTVLASVLGMAEASLKAMTIAKLGVDGSRMRFAADTHNGNSEGGLSEPWFAMLLLGVIAGAGGGMWTDLLGLKSHQWTLSTPSFVRFATYDMKTSLLGSFFYAASTSPQFRNVWRSGDDTDILAKGGLLEAQDAKAMMILVMCTLKLGQQAEPVISRYIGFSLSPTNWMNALQTNLATPKKHDGGDGHVASSPSNTDREDSHRPLRRRGRKLDESSEGVESAAEEEEEEEPVKKGPRGGKKTASSKRQASPSRTASPSPADPPLVRSTRTRKPVRKDL
ncbi:hypothetical protein BGX34_006926 [Mortierella sp. NVP85]|nr:hypothetical protein BGX34_006926 [Mortierella sp. NVP85]